MEPPGRHGSLKVSALVTPYCLLIGAVGPIISGIG
jgi:hypothetical protein